MMDEITAETPVDKKEQGRRQLFIGALLEKREAITHELQELGIEAARVQRELSQKVEQLEARRQLLQNGIQHVEALLRLEGWNREPERGATVSPDNRLSPADAAFALLKEASEPTHYKEIAKQLLDQGIPLSGKNPQATLLSYLVRDARFKRAIPRGVYGLSEWKFKTAKSRRRRQKRARK